MTPGTRPHLLHAALLYDSAEELVAAAVPFLADGLTAGDVVMLACSKDDNALLAGELADSDRLLVLDDEEMYTRGAQALAVYRRMMRRQVAAGASRVRLVGAVPPHRRREQWDEWHRCEAVFNAAMGRMPLSAVCPYDRREISDSMREGVEQTHPVLLTPHGLVPNDGYLEPEAVLRRTARTRRHAEPAGPPALDVSGLADASELPALRARVRAMLDGTDGNGPLRGRFATALTEVLGNAFRHGVPPVAVRLWTTPTRLEATVTERGQGFDEPLAGYLPPGHGPSAVGAGLWVARQCCDTLETVRSPAGFSVRLTTVLPTPGTPPPSSSEAGSADTGTARADRARAEARALVRRLHARG